MGHQQLHNLLHNKPKIRQSFARYFIPSLSTTFRLESTSRKWHLGHFIQITFERKGQTVVRSRYVSSVERMPVSSSRVCTDPSMPDAIYLPRLMTALWWLFVTPVRTLLQPFACQGRQTDVTSRLDSVAKIVECIVWAPDLRGKQRNVTWTLHAPLCSN